MEWKRLVGLLRLLYCTPRRTIGPDHHEFTIILQDTAEFNQATKLANSLQALSTDSFYHLILISNLIITAQSIKSDHVSQR